VCGGCEEDDFIERAFRAHKLASKKQIFVGKIPIKPTNAARHIVQFTTKQLRSLDMHPAQYVRLMSNSGHYVLAPEMVASGASPICMITNLQPVMTLVYLHVCVMTAVTFCICVIFCLTVRELLNPTILHLIHGACRSPRWVGRQRAVSLLSVC
jgi:hypothetical protein